MAKSGVRLGFTSKPVPVIVVGDMKRELNKDREWVSKLDTSYGKGFGVWAACKNGSYISTYSGSKNLKPGTKGFEY